MTDMVGIDNGGARAAIVYQGRLVLVGSAAVPDLVMASKISDVEPGPNESPPVDFAIEQRNGVATPASGFWFEQVSARGNAFHAVIQQEGLFILGDIGESTVPAGPFTSAQVEIRENSWYGTERGLLPLIVGGMVMFVQSGGKDLRGINWDEIQRKYVAPSMLTRSGQVFDKAVDVTYSVSSGRRPDSAYVVAEDGSIAVLVLPHAAWSKWETRQPDPDDPNKTKPAKFKAIAAPGTHHMFLVERGGRVGLEYFDDTDRANTPTGWKDPGDMPIKAIFEGVPFVAPSRTGSKRSVTKCRMLDVILEFVNPLVPTMRPENTTSMGLKPRVWRVLQEIREERHRLLDARPRDLESQLDALDAREQEELSEGRDTKKWPRRTPGQETDKIAPVRFGGLSGWRTRASVRMQVEDPCELAGFSYKAMG